MKIPATKKIYDLLGTRQIPGNPDQLYKLRVRIGDLMRMNGKDWVRKNRQELLREWEYALKRGFV